MEREQEFAEFAIECGLTRFPDPTGERYVYNVDCSFAGKGRPILHLSYVEIDLMDELWNALARAKDRPDMLIE